MIEVVLLSSFSALFAAVIGLVAFFIIIKKNNNKGGKPEVPVSKTITINDGDIYKICGSGNDCLGIDFDKSRPKGKMCNGKLATSSAGAASFKFSKDGEYWAISTDCDNDGNFTSYLTRDKDLIWAKLDDPVKQRWTIECNDTGCAFKSKRDSKYLTKSFAKAEFSTAPEYFQMTK
jgi:hypothetical protein